MKNKKKVASFIGLNICFLGFFFQAIAQICHNDHVVLTQNGVCNYDSWVLVLDEDFNGIEIDKSKWDLIEGVRRDYTFQNEKQWYSKDNLEVANGILSIYQLLQPDYRSYWDASTGQNATSFFNFTSGEIESRYRYGYGIYEIRCKLPDNIFWPAFWMYGGGGASGSYFELDVFEFWNKEYKWNRTTHRSGYGFCSEKSNLNDPTNWHTFTLIWDNYKVAWYVDGSSFPDDVRTKFYTILWQYVDCNSLTAPNPYYLNRDLETFERPMQIIANVAIEPNEFINSFPDFMEVDYIRYWKQKNCLGNPTYSSLSNLALSSSIYNFKPVESCSISNVVFSSTLPLPQLEIVASDYIEIGPSVVFETGFDYIGRIGNTSCVSGSKIYNNFCESEIAESSMESKVIWNLYPNPSHGIFNITWNSMEPIDFSKCELEVYNIEGENQIFKNDINSSQLTVDIASLPDGMYYLLLKYNNQIWTRKIVKIK
jgi:beta-glucanase (GH16 family)